MIDFGYDVSDHCDVDPSFGSLTDFDGLLARAHRLGLRVIVDFVPNHTSARHPWFRESRATRDGDQRDWYVWADGRAAGGAPNNWLSCFERVGAAWTLDERTGQYYLHSYTAEQPDLNWRNGAVRAAMEHVLRFWLERGVDGFRIDAPHRLIKHAQMEDNPPEIAHLRVAEGRPAPPLRNLNQPEVHEPLRRFRRILDDYPGCMAVGEVGIWDVAEAARYYGRGDELDLVFNFAFWSQPWSPAAFAGVVEEVERALPGAAWPAYALSNHDLSRVATRFGPRRAPVAAVMLLTLRGTPFLYYGEEIGMHDVRLGAQWARDSNGRDPARTPMQWDPGSGAGFTTGRPWLPVPRTARSVNVASERRDAGSLLNLYRRLLRLRRRCRALQLGGYRPVLADDTVFAYLRELGCERVLVALNFAERPVTCRLTAGGTYLLSTNPHVDPGTQARFPLRLDAGEGVVIRLSATLHRDAADDEARAVAGDAERLRSARRPG